MFIPLKRLMFLLVTLHVITASKQAHATTVDSSFHTRVLISKDGSAELLLQVDDAISSAYDLKNVRVTINPADGSKKQKEKIREVQMINGVGVVQLMERDIGRGDTIITKDHQGAKASQAQCENKKSCKKLEDTTIALLRPNIALDAVQAPSEVNVGDTVNISVDAHETNLDLGIVCGLGLFCGEQELDSIDTFTSEAGGFLSAVFTTSFDQSGAQNLEVRVKDCDPYDDDPADNRIAFAIQVIEPTINKATDKMSYGMEYYRYTLTDWTRGAYAVSGTANLFYNYETRNVTERESFRYTAQVTRGGELQATEYALFSDGVLIDSQQNEGPISSVIDRECSRQRIAFSPPTLSTVVYAEVLNCPPTTNRISTTTFSYSRYAGDTIYYSRWYLEYWGQIDPVVQNTHTTFGEFFRPQEHLRMQTAITTSKGIFGGVADVTVQKIADYAWGYDQSWNGGWWKADHSYTQQTMGSSYGWTNLNYE